MQVLVVAFGHLLPDHFETALEYSAKANETLEGMDGFVSSTMWRNMRNPDQVLLLSRYRDILAAEEGLNRLTEAGVLLQAMDALAAPPEAYRVVVHEHAGKWPETAPMGSCCSVSMRTADPGYGEDLMMDLTDVFGGMIMMPGFLGNVIGVNEAMPDQVFGVAFWTDVVAFNSSLPSDLPFEIQVFERAA